MSEKREPTKHVPSLRLEVHFDSPLPTLDELVAWTSAVQAALNLGAVDVMEEDRDRERERIPRPYGIGTPEHKREEYLQSSHPAAVLASRFDSYVGNKYRAFFYEGLAAAFEYSVHVEHPVDSERARFYVPPIEGALQRFLHPRTLYGDAMQLYDFQEFWQEEFGTKAARIETIGEIGSWGFAIDVAYIATLLAFQSAPAASEAIRYALGRLKEWIGEPRLIRKSTIRPKLPPGLRDVLRNAKEVELEVTDSGFKLHVINA